MEVLANKIADKISEKLNLESEKRAVIAYGLLGILQVVTLFILIAVLGIMTGTFYESFIIFFSVGFMRKSTGGAHSRTMWGCNAVSVLSILSLALLSRYVLGVPAVKSANVIITLAVFGVGFLIFYRKVPVDSPNKPITSPHKIKRLRKESYLKLVLLLAATLLCIHFGENVKRLYSISSSIRMAAVWQIITLTEIGAAFLNKIDAVIGRTLQL